jgi:hypothetical protein
MRTWQFQQADVLLTNATTVLDQRTAIATAAAASRLTVPPTLRTAFESPDGFASATLEATAELEAIRRYDAAVAARPSAPNPMQQAGLWNTTPENDLERARTLFASGDLTGSAEAASAAAGTWSNAEDIGRGRFVSIGLLVLALFLALILITVSVRGRRRRAAAGAALGAAAGAAPGAAPDPYATLGPSADPTQPVDVRGAGARGAEPD